MDTLVERPTILELRWITDEEERALILAVLLVRLYEYLVVQSIRPGGRPAAGSGLRHVTLFEEAHQLLSGTPKTGGSSEEASATGRSLAVFANMLSEIRAFGEGIIIADQIPAKLLRDVVKNTDLKIAHTLRAPDDRELMGKAMNLNAHQEAYLGILPAGQAAVHFEGLEEPTLVQFPDFKADQGVGAAEISDADIARQMFRFRRQHPEVFQSEMRCPVSCRQKEECPYEEPIESALKNKTVARELLATALATLAGGDGRRRFLFLASTQLKREARMDIAPEHLADFLRCSVYQAGRSIVEPHARDAGVSSNDLRRLLLDFVQCHEPLIARADDDPARLSRLWDGFGGICRPAFLPAAGCDLCRRQCMFYHVVQLLLVDGPTRRKAIDAFNDKVAGRQKFHKTCLEAAVSVIGHDDRVTPHAAFCFAVQLLEDKGVTDMDLFGAILKNLTAERGADNERQV